MIGNLTNSPKRVLQPHERISEVLFGLIMVLTFTGSLSVATAGREDVRTMLVGALGCNIAWGLIDGLLYLMASLAEKGTNLRTLRAVRSASAEKARKLISDAVPKTLAEVLDEKDLDMLHARLSRLPEPPEKATLSLLDWRGATGVFLLVFLTTFPVAIPFIFMKNAMFAMRLSNAIAVGMLFLAGAAYGRIIGRSPIAIGVSMVFIGAVLVAVTMALGG